MKEGDGRASAVNQRFPMMQMGTTGYNCGICPESPRKLWRILRRRDFSNNHSAGSVLVGTVILLVLQYEYLSMDTPQIACYHREHPYPWTRATFIFLFFAPGADKNWKLKLLTLELGYCLRGTQQYPLYTIWIYIPISTYTSSSFEF